MFFYFTNPIRFFFLILSVAIGHNPLFLFSLKRPILGLWDSKPIQQQPPQGATWLRPIESIHTASKPTSNYLLLNMLHFCTYMHLSEVLYFNSHLECYLELRKINHKLCNRNSEIDVNRHLISCECHVVLFLICDALSSHRRRWGIYATVCW